MGICRAICVTPVISIHALLAESDLVNGDVPSSCFGNFYPRSPCGERHTHPIGVLVTVIFLSTLSLRRATIAGRITSKGTKISIHALLAESDLFFGRDAAESRYFYPRSPCGERLQEQILVQSAHLFLSTLSLRRATFCDVSLNYKEVHFYPRSPCGERLLVLRKITITVDISIHALLAESDQL